MTTLSPTSARLKPAVSVKDPSSPSLNVTLPSTSKLESSDPSAFRRAMAMMLVKVSTRIDDPPTMILPSA
jgi:hypothetical protein